MKRRDFIKNASLALSAAFVPNIAFPSFLRGGCSSKQCSVQRCRIT